LNWRLKRKKKEKVKEEGKKKAKKEKTPRMNLFVGGQQSFI